MKNYKVRDSQVVLVLTKAEGKFLLRGIGTGYFQATRLKSEIIVKLQDALAEVGEADSVGINVGGMVYVKPVREWHRLAAAGSGEPKCGYMHEANMGDTCEYCTPSPAPEVREVAQADVKLSGFYGNVYANREGSIESSRNPDGRINAAPAPSPAPEVRDVAREIELQARLDERRSARLASFGRDANEVVVIHDERIAELRAALRGKEWR